MRFRVLGHLEVWSDRQLPPLSPRQERLLARLLLSPNKIVSISSLSEALWDDEPPSSAERQVQNTASQLRASWASAGVDDIKRTLRTVRGGYVLQTDPDHLDIATFRRLVAESTALQESGDVVEAVRGMRGALALWRGPAFAGIDSAVIEANAVIMNQERIEAWEQCLAWELSLGQHRQVVTELTGLVKQFPFREQLTSLLMVSFYRLGRQHDALAAFREVRERLNQELGIEPGPALHDLHQQILLNDPALLGPAETATVKAPPVSAPAPAVSVPSQIPPPVGFFVGRGAELERLTQESGRAQVIVVTGAAGMGKTSVVAHWARTARDGFPDRLLAVVGLSSFLLALHKPD